MAIWEEGFNAPLFISLLGVFVLISTSFTILLVTLPDRYIGEHVLSPTKKKYITSVQIVVLGDIGRSPRMQYHALSIAKKGGKVSIIGIQDSDVHPSITASPDITIFPIRSSPKFLQTSNRSLIPLFAPIKAIWQACSLYHALGYAAPVSEWILVQNPPSIPTFTICNIIGFFRSSKIIVDWHNFGYSLLALKLGPKHFLVRWYESWEFAGGSNGDVHFCVTNAMAEELKERGIEGALPLHDRPSDLFMPITNSQQREKHLAEILDAKQAEEITSGARKLIVSSTSYTPDEDFSILLDALVTYAATPKLPNIAVVITGKGPLEAHYAGKIADLVSSGKLPAERVTIQQMWLPSMATYAHLLASADLGVSLHQSSSGLDLPMKVVDMFGAGIPVVGCRFAAWSELVTEGVDGRGFTGAEELADVLAEVVGSDTALATLKTGAMKQSKTRWDDEWNRVAGRVIFYEKKPIFE